MTTPPRRKVRIGARIVEVRVRPATYKRRAVMAIQIVRDCGAATGIESLDTRSLHSKIYASPNLTAYILPSVLDTITDHEWSAK